MVPEEDGRFDKGRPFTKADTQLKKRDWEVYGRTDWHYPHPLKRHLRGEPGQENAHNASCKSYKSYKSGGGGVTLHGGKCPTVPEEDGRFDKGRPFTKAAHTVEEMGLGSLWPHRLALSTSPHKASARRSGTAKCTCEGTVGLFISTTKRYVIHSFEQQKDASTERWDETTSFGTVIAVLITEMLDHHFFFITNPHKVQKCKRQYRCEASDPIVYEQRLHHG